jgi:hypothetical protein
MATSFSGGRSRSTRREPLTMGKQLVNFINCGQEWDSIKYQESFQIMFQLVNQLQLNTADETKIMNDLTKWETNGIT